MEHNETIIDTISRDKFHVIDNTNSTHIYTYLLGSIYPVSEMTSLLALGI